MTAICSVASPGPADAAAIASLHADSWRRQYRGACSDSFLDGDVTANRLAVWTALFAQPDRGRCTLVAEERGALVGFAHVVFDDDPIWGALLDNLTSPTGTSVEALARSS